MTIGPIPSIAGQVRVDAAGAMNAATVPAIRGPAVLAARWEAAVLAADNLALLPVVHKAHRVSEIRRSGAAAPGRIGGWQPGLMIVADRRRRHAPAQPAAAPSDLGAIGAPRLATASRPARPTGVALVPA
jgi:hypothetical protein